MPAPQDGAAVSGRECAVVRSSRRYCLRRRECGCGTFATVKPAPLPSPVSWTSAETAGIFVPNKKMARSLLLQMPCPTMPHLWRSPVQSGNPAFTALEEPAPSFGEHVFFCVFCRNVRPNAAVPDFQPASIGLLDFDRPGTRRLHNHTIRRAPSEVKLFLKLSIRFLRAAGARCASADSTAFRDIHSRRRRRAQLRSYL